MVNDLIVFNKSKLRKEIKEMISQLNDEYCEMADQAIFRKVVQLPQFQDAKNVALFVSSFGEPNTLPIIEYALANGKQVALPLCVDDSKMVFKVISSMNDVSEGTYGILEPREYCCEMEPLSIEFMLVPCVTCNKEGHRLGHGRGYYDRFFASVESAGSAEKAGREGLFKCVVCRGQLMRDDIPLDDFDVPVDAVIWEGADQV